MIIFRVILTTIDVFKRYENAVWSLRGWVSHVSSVGTKKRSVMWKRKSHFMNSVLSTPGTYSCALDSFLEISSHLFLPYLSTLTARNEFTELLFNTCKRYIESQGNDRMLREIRKPIWVYLQQQCPSFLARDSIALRESLNHFVRPAMTM